MNSDKEKLTLSSAVKLLSIHCVPLHPEPCCTILKTFIHGCTHLQGFHHCQGAQFINWKGLDQKTKFCLEALNE